MELFPFQFSIYFKRSIISFQRPTAVSEFSPAFRYQLSVTSWVSDKIRHSPDAKYCYLTLRGSLFLPFCQFDRTI